MSRFVPLPYYYAIPDWVLTPTGGAGALYDIGLGEVVTTFGGAESLFELDLEVLAREPISVGFPGLGFIEFQLFAGLTDAEAGFAFGFAWRHDGDQVVEATIPLAIVLTTPLLTPAILTDEGPEPDPSTDAVSIQLTTNVSWVSSTGPSLSAESADFPPTLIADTGFAISAEGFELTTDPAGIAFDSLSLHMPAALRDAVTKITVTDGRVDEAGFSSTAAWVGPAGGVALSAIDGHSVALTSISFTFEENALVAGVLEVDFPELVLAIPGVDWISIVLDDDGGLELGLRSDGGDLVLSLTGLAVGLRVEGDAELEADDTTSSGSATDVPLGSFDFELTFGGELSVTLEPSLTDDLVLGMLAGASFLPFVPDWITVDIVATASGVAVTVGIDLAADLGVISATSDGLALGLAVQGGDEGLQMSVVVVPPVGLGVGIDADVASGGAYLFMDAEAGEFAGVGDVAILGVEVTATGVLPTQLPDGSDGFSLFLSLSATFTGIQLGFGFTLNGVGGLIGVHRGLDPEALGDGIRTGAMDSVLFPDDPIADAPRILSDIEAIFPIQPEQYVFGPVGKIGWGTPTLIEADVGVVVQLPDPWTFTLLGSLGMELPSKDAPLLILNIDVAGTFDPGAGTIAIDASLRDSQVVGLSLSGDMAMRASFLDDPSFLLSFGGFNPHFLPPADFPTLNRLSVSLETGDALRIGMWGYFALTSNTVQFGSGADLWASAVGLTVEGHFSFDALIHFNPFLFIIDLGFSVDVKAGSVELFGVFLDLMLEGPNPFHVVGTATMKILGIKTTFELDETIGKKELEPPRETVYVQDEIVTALSEADAWREAPPDADALSVTFAEEDGLQVRVHPAGSLEVVQSIAPLKRTLDTVGAAKLGDLDRVELVSPMIGTDDATTEDVEDHFASAQFFDMGDDDKLSAPSFELMPAGIRFGDTEIESPKPHAFVLDYEQIVRDPDLDDDDRKPTALFSPDARSLAIAVKSSALSRARKAAGLTTSKTKTSPFAIADTQWVVTDVATAAVDATLTPTATSWSEAREAALTTNTEDARVLTPAHEAS